MKREWFVPAAIVFAGVVISVAIYVTHHHAAGSQDGNPEAALPVNVTTDHIVGNPAAPVVLIEYTDINSEYAKDFEQVMEQVMQSYGPQGNVAWVYRDFPLVDADTTSEEADEAAECVAALGKPSDFFSFVDALQADAPGDSVFDPADFDSVVSSLGISTGSFDDCLTAHTYEKKVEADYQNALAVGATGAPYSILFVKGQKPIVISGFVPYDTMKQVLDTETQKVLAQ